MIADKNIGKCEACGLSIIEGDNYVRYAKTEDVIKKGRTTKLMQGKESFNLHKVCADMVRNRDEIDDEPKDIILEWVGLIWNTSLPGKTLEEVISVVPEMDDIFIEKRQKIIKRWREFYLERVKKERMEGRDFSAETLGPVW
jgi:hypothetical protein